MVKTGVLIISLMLFSFISPAQQSDFPAKWIGNWKGDLLWYKTPGKDPERIKMQLKIQPTDSVHKYTWQIIYGDSTKDNRPYNLVAKDIVKGHWVIDENNGIVLDQFWMADRFCGAFTVLTSTIVNNYWMENGKLVAEFSSISSKAINTTGKGTEDIPYVDSYRMKSYQKAVLFRSN